MITSPPAAATALPRRRFRRHDLDGAALFFHPDSGVHLRVTSPATRALRRRAPRAVMFGITNACNLSCSFCSRDVARDSRWTVASAASTLRELARAGALEVAYGGGEPFAFPGFAELVTELHAGTELAQHVTTNGTLLREATWPRFAGRFGIVRLSIYDHADWRRAARLLREVGQRWGANLLVEPATLAGLPSLLEELARFGAHDVSLLAYVGAERARHLARHDDVRLAAIVARSPLPCRVSVCFGRRLALPLLGDASDCGAGRDFVSVTPDQRVQACSFQDASVPGADAAQILAAWRAQGAVLTGASPRAGCARGSEGAALDWPQLAIWQSFSGNNSGECLMVARFAQVADAEAYLATLLPGFVPEDPYSAAWRDLFTTERVDAAVALEHGEMPRDLFTIGASVVAAHYAPDDILRDLRALATKRGAEVRGAVHLHDDATALVAVRARDAAERDALLAAQVAPSERQFTHREVVVKVLSLFRHSGHDTLAALRDAILAWAAGRPLAFDVLCDEVRDADLLVARQRLGVRQGTTPRLAASFWGAAEGAAGRLAASIGECATSVGTWLVVDPAPDRKRLAVLAYRAGGDVVVLDSERVRVCAGFWLPRPTPSKGGKAPARDFDHAALAEFAARGFARDDKVEVAPPDEPHTLIVARLVVTTANPGRALIAANELARQQQWEIWCSFADVDPLGRALRRLIGDLR